MYIFLERGEFFYYQYMKWAGQINVINACAFLLLCRKTRTGYSFSPVRMLRDKFMRIVH